MTELILYSRSYCHLCDDLLAALQGKFGERYAFKLTVVDVDLDETLIAKYDELVPVLVAMKNGVSTQLCHYFLDEARVEGYLAAS